MTDLLTQLVDAIDRRQPCVWCLVAATRGSTPQKAGAAMLVFPDGSQMGTLGGGCVEAEVKRRVVHRLAAGGGTEVFTFNLDDDYGWDDGLICGGRMTILAHPISPDRPDYPDAGVRWALEPALGDSGGTLDVLDLGAGTGKLTASLVAQRADQRSLVRACRSPRPITIARRQEGCHKLRPVRCKSATAMHCRLFGENG